MTNNVVWGTDFKAFPRPLSDEQKQSLCEERIRAALYHGAGLAIPPDTTPSDYTAPTDDCA